MSKIITPHIDATSEDEIAKTVIMPGDPLRAKYIAENFLTDITLFNRTRNILGYTGYYKNKKVSVMASGMGMPSIGIYSYELYKFYGVEYILRVGSAGSYVDDLKLYDTVLVNSSYTDSSFGKCFADFKIKTLKSSLSFNKIILKKAKELNMSVKQVNCHCTDIFYRERVLDKKYIEKFDCRCVEMESYGLFATAKALSKKASCLLTISDSIVTKEQTTKEEREKNFKNMIILALESAIK